MFQDASLPGTTFVHLVPSLSTTSFVIASASWVVNAADSGALSDVTSPSPPDPTSLGGLYAMIYFLLLCHGEHCSDVFWLKLTCSCTRCLRYDIQPQFTTVGAQSSLGVCLRGLACPGVRMKSTNTLI